MVWPFSFFSTLLFTTKSPIEPSPRRNLTSTPDGLAGANDLGLRFQHASRAVPDIGRHDRCVTAAEGFRVVAEKVIEFRRPG